MQFIDTQTVANMLPYGQLIEALRIAFKEQICSPERTQYKIETNEVSDATLLLMPAWKKSQHIGIKVVSVFPENTKSSLSAVNASYLLLDAKNGLPKVIMDGTELTLRRTACASALAADYLTRDDVSSMLMVGTGNLAPHLIEAHMQLRDIRKVMIWGRDYQKALILAKKLKYKGVEISAINDLYEGVQMVDIVSCATLSNTPLILGEWLKKGQHIDLVGAFTPEMHEVDSQALKMANVIVDTYAGALSESGELIDAIKEGLFFEKDIIAEMSEIVKQQKIGRNNKNEITLFKSVGAALEDLAAAELVLTNLSETI